MTTATERRQEIGKTIHESMAALKDIDWSKESESITFAQKGLDESVTAYCEGNASKAEVKASYKAWVNSHRGGLF